MFNSVDRVHGHFLQYENFKVIVGRIDSTPSWKDKENPIFGCLKQQMIGGQEYEEPCPTGNEWVPRKGVWVKSL